MKSLAAILIVVALCGYVVGHTRYYRMVPISEYDIELQELSQPPPIPAQVMTPPPFAPEPKEFLTPPPLSINVPEFYQLYIMHNGIEEPITSFSQFMPETVPPPQSQPPRREVSNKITKIFPFVENRQPKRIQATPEVSSYLNHPIMDDGYVQLPPQTFPPHQFAHRQPLPPPFVFMDQPRMMPPPPPFMGGHPMVIPFQGHPPMMPQYFHMVPMNFEPPPMFLPTSLTPPPPVMPPVQYFQMVPTM